MIIQIQHEWSKEPTMQQRHNRNPNDDRDRDNRNANPCLRIHRQRRRNQLLVSFLLRLTLNRHSSQMVIVKTLLDPPRAASQPTATVSGSVLFATPALQPENHSPPSARPQLQRNCLLRSHREG